MINSKSILITTILFSSAALAQKPKAHITLKPGLFGGAPVVHVDGNEIKPSFGLLGAYRLSDAMKSNSLAAEYARKHESYGRWASGVLWGGLGAALGYLAFTKKEDVSYTAYWLIFGTGFVTSAVLQRSSMAYLFKAMNAYNGIDAQLTLLPTHEGAQLSLALKF